MRLLLFSSLIFVQTLVVGQTYKISGLVADIDDHSALQGAIVKLFPDSATNLIVGTETDSTGGFEFANLTNGLYRIEVSYIGYKPYQRKVKVNAKDKTLGLVGVAKNPTTFKEVQIVAKEDRVKIKEDTAEYNANAYKVNPDANAEDLVTKMPGISSDNGTVKAHGENVQKVYVDGKEFFGDDATLALKNLPAEIIDKIQVFDHMSDQAQFTGFDDGSTQKAINITTKKGRNNGVFGRVYAGYGYLDDSRYSAGGNLNWFNGDRRISIIGMSNNINQQNFSTQDLLGLTGGSARGGSGGGASFGRRGGGGGGQGGGQGGGGGGSSNFLVGQQGGISTTHSAGINYSDVWGKKVKVSASYFFNQTDNITNSEINRQYYNAGDSAQTYKETDYIKSRNANHRISLRLEYMIDSMNKIIFTPKASVQQNTQYSTSFEQTFVGGGTELQAQTNSAFHAYNLGYNISGDLLYQHKFKKPRRTFSIDISGTVNNKRGNSSLNSSNYYSDVNDSTLIDQQSNSYNYGYTAAANLSYTEPIGKTSMLQFNYTPSNTWSHANQNTYNYDSLSKSYNDFDTSLSNKYNNIYMTHKGGISYRYSNKKLMLMFGVNAQYALLSGEEIFPSSSNTRKPFFNVLPQAMLTYKFTDKSSLRVFYRTSTNPPSIQQLQNVINNSNTLILTTGNPDLKQTYSHSLIIRYGLTNTKTATSFFAFGSVNYTQNYVGNSTLFAAQDTALTNEIILHKGSQLVRSVNLNQGSLTANSFLTYGFPLEKIKCNLNLNAGFSYTHTPSLNNNLLNLSDSYTPTAGFVLGSNINEKIDFTISYTGNYNIVKNSLQSSLNSDYFTHNANLKFNWLFYKGFVFNTTLQNTVYTGVAQGYNQDIFLWNLSLGYKFFKDKSLDVRAGVNDVLNQNSGISRSINDAYIQDTRTQVLKRYWMVTVSWTLRYFKKEATPAKI